MWGLGLEKIMSNLLSPRPPLLGVVTTALNFLLLRLCEGGVPLSLSLIFWVSDATT